jgi:hypothetical protein
MQKGVHFMRYAFYILITQYILKQENKPNKRRIYKSVIEYIECKITLKGKFLMKRIMLFSFAAVFLIILFSLYLSFFGNPIDKYQIVKATKEYLVEKGYDKPDILSIESDYHFKRNSDNMSGIVSYVVFKDEPTIQYTFVQWKRTKEIQQTLYLL